MSVPFLTLSLSSEGILNKWNDLDKRVAELCHKLSYSTDFPDATGWTVVESTAGNVTLSGGVWTMNGNNLYGANGIYLTSGHTRAEGIYEIKANNINVLYVVGLISSISSFAGLPALAAVRGHLSSNTSMKAFYGASPLSSVTAIVANAWYTLRIYIMRSNNNAAIGRIRVTVEGSGFSSETTIVELDYEAATFPTSPIYPSIQRNTNSAANPLQVKEYRWYSGYETNGDPKLIGIADAGVGRKFVNFDPTKITVPISLSTAYNKVAYDFSDSATPSLGDYYTYTELLSRPKILSEKRYIHISVQQNSDGVVQPYAGIELTEGVVDGVNFAYQRFSLDKSVVSVTAGTLITVTLDNDLASIMTGLTLKGVACTDRTVTGANTLTFVTPDLTAGIGNIEGVITGYDNFVITNAITAQAGASAPGAVTVTGYATGKYANLSWSMAATSVTYDIEIDGVVYTGYTSLSAEIAMPRANTEYSFRVRGVNTTGNGTWSTAITVKTEVVADDETITLAGTAVLSSVEDLTGTLHIAQGMTGATIFDPIILPTAISQETFEYYVKDVLYNQGRNVL